MFLSRKMFIKNTLALILQTQHILLGHAVTVVSSFYRLLKMVNSHDLQDPTDFSGGGPCPRAMCKCHASMLHDSFMLSNRS